MNDNPRIERDARPFVAAASFLRGRGETLCLTAHGGESAALRAALAEAAEDGLSPRIVALPQLLAAAAAGVAAADLAAAARLSSASESAARRETALEIYARLRESSPPFAPAELLSRAAALADFFAEFIDSRASLCIDKNELPRLCEEMALSSSGSFADETKAVSLLWETLYPRLHSARRALADFARVAPPILYVGEEPRRPWLDDFLRQCARGATIIAPHDAAAPAANGGSAADNFRDMCAGWRPRAAHIARCREGFAASPHRAAMLALSALRDFAAADAEGEIGIVVYDRLLARRLRALAENDGIRIKDDGGWRMETLSFGGALRQWTDAACAFAPGQFGKMLFPPFWGGHPHRAKAAAEWRRLLAGDRALPSSLRDCARFPNAAFAPFAENLAAARRNRPREAAPRLWTKWLLRHSAAAMTAWRRDAVAAELRAELASAMGDEKLNATEFRAWLAMFMRGETGGGRGVSSRACFVPPSTSRRFASLLLLGARADTLPPSSDLFWGDNGRRALSLPGRGEYVARQIAQFSRLTAAHDNIAAIWQNADDGLEMPPSPFWTLLTDAIKNSGKTVETIAAADAADAAFPAASPVADLRPPSPAIGRIRASPPVVGVTAAADLMRCPYHFFARHLLRLGEEDGDDILSPAARGGLLHRGLKEFAEKAGDEACADKLLALWRETISALPAARPGAKLAIQHWLLRGELFVRGEAARRADGWLPHACEYEVKTPLHLSGGETLLRGRIDRIDRRADEWTIIDYKSGGGPNGKEMRAGEDPQLPLYAILLGAPRARWRISRPADDAKSIETPGNALRIAARLRAAARRIAAGAPMYARKSAACADCPSRRLCRRDHWQLADGETAAK